MNSSEPAVTDEQILMALLENPKLEKAAAALGISATTLWRRRSRPDFQAKYRAARREEYSRAMARLGQVAMAAVTILSNTMMDPKTSDANRFQASRSTVTKADEFEHLEDLIARLEVLENQKVPARPAPSAFSTEDKAPPTTTETAAGKTERIMVAMLQYGSRKKAAAELGISDTTLWRWLKQPKIQLQYQQARRQVLSGAAAQLQHMANLAVTTLAAIMASKKASVGLQLRVSNWVLEHLKEACEHADVQVPIERLEQAKQKRAA